MKNLIKISDFIVKHLVMIIIVCSIIAFGVTNITYMMAYKYMFSIKEWLWMPVALFIVMGCYLFAKATVNKSDRAVVTIVVIATNIVYFLLIYAFWNYQPNSDWGELWLAAKEMAGGVFVNGLDPTKYMYMCNWQLGMAFFESLFVRVFGEQLLVLKVVNVICLNLITYGIYHLAKRKCGMVSARFTYILTAFLFAYLFTSPQLSNHQVGLVLILLAFYLVEKEQYWSVLVAGVCLGMLNIVRPMGIICILSAVCLFVYHMLKSKKCKKYIICLLCLILPYLAVTEGFNQLLLAMDYTDIKVTESRVPYYKFAVGLYGYEMTPAPGLRELDYDYEAFNEQMKNELMNKVKHEPVSLISFSVKKMLRMYGGYDSHFLLGYDFDDENYAFSYPAKAIYSISWFQYAFYLLLALYGYWLYRKKNEVDVWQIFFIGNTLVYFFIEGHSFYRFEHYVYLLLMAGVACTKINKSYGNRKQNG